MKNNKYGEIGKGVEFTGNYLTDLFGYFFYYFFLITSVFFQTFFFRNYFLNKDDKKVILFVYRSWGRDLSLNLEIKDSLIEYCGVDNLILLEVPRYGNIVNEISKALVKYSISHVIFDTRVMLTKNGIFNIIKSLYQCCFLSNVVSSAGATVLCGLTDVVMPGYRLQAELLTSRNGVAIGWGGVAFSEVRKFRHSRKVGPLFHPYSIKILDDSERNSVPNNREIDVAIMGSNYEPRGEFIREIVPLLEKKNISVYLNTSKDLSYKEYLDIYKKSKIGFNTNWVVGKKHKYNLVARNFEIMVCGSLLLTQHCSGLDVYVDEGQDYIS